MECFCFEEQKIRAGEEVDLPVFFFIDRDIMDEPQLDGLDDVVLSYTFFKWVMSGGMRSTAGHDETSGATSFRMQPRTLFCGHRALSTTSMPSRCRLQHQDSQCIRR